MASHRVERLAGELKREIADILDHEIKDPRLGLVSVVSLTIAPDGCSAHIYVSPLQNDADLNGIAAALGSATGYIRRELGKRLRTRIVPELFFHVDASIAYGVQMTKIISEQISADQQAALGREPEEPGKYKE